MIVPMRMVIFFFFPNKHRIVHQQHIQQRNNEVFPLLFVVSSLYDPNRGQGEERGILRRCSSSRALCGFIFWFLLLFLFPFLPHICWYILYTISVGLVLGFLVVGSLGAFLNFSFPIELELVVDPKAKSLSF